MNTLQHLQVVMPGQPIAWYERIAAEIEAGRMPMPQLLPVKVKAPPPPPPMLREVEIIRPATIETITSPEELKDEPPPVVKTTKPNTVYSLTKEELSHPVDDVKPPKEFVSRKAKIQQKKAQKASQKKAKQKTKKQKPPVPSKPPELSKPPTPSKPPSTPILYAPIAEAPPPLSRDLLTLCRNDHKLAARLVKHQLYLHPEKDFKWAQEKVIWDLERDRR